MERTFLGELQGCFLYSRHSNPTVNIFGKKIAAMERTEAALGVASGMAPFLALWNSSLGKELLQGGTSLLQEPYTEEPTHYLKMFFHHEE